MADDKLPTGTLIYNDLQASVTALLEAGEQHTASSS